MKRRAIIAGVVTALMLGGITVVFAVLQEDGPPPAPDRPASKPKPGAPPYAVDLFQPFFYDRAADDDFLARGASGQAHVVYALTTDGVEQAVERMLPFRDEIERATAGSGIDPDDLEAMAFLESAGRPDAMADGTPSSASGLMQILPETAVALLGMRVDTVQSNRIFRAIERNQRRAVLSVKPKKKRAARRKVKELVRELKRVDERFDPEKALAGAVRYLTIAEQRFARRDLAITAYHMGIGNLRTLIARYVAPRAQARTTPGTVKRFRITWPRLYYDSSPVRNPRTWGLLSSLGDDSRHYLFKVEASKEILRLAREDRDQLRETIEAQTAKASAEEVLRPESRFPPYEDNEDLREAFARSELVPLPNDPKRLGYRIGRGMGSLAKRLKQPRILYQGLRREALAALLYISKEYRRIAGKAYRPLRVTSTVRDLPYQELLVHRNVQATSEFSLHTTGFAIDIAKPKAEGPLRFMLERLQALNVISWVEEPGAFHMTVGPGAKALMPLYEALVLDRRPIVR